MIAKIKSMINKLLPMNNPTPKPYHLTHDEVVFKMWIKSQMRKDKFKFTNFEGKEFELRTVSPLECWNIFEGIDGNQCYSLTLFNSENKIENIIIFESLFDFDQSLDS